MNNSGRWIVFDLDVFLTVPERGKVKVPGNVWDGLRSLRAEGHRLAIVSDDEDAAKLVSKTGLSLQVDKVSLMPAQTPRARLVRSVVGPEVEFDPRNLVYLDGDFGSDAQRLANVSAEFPGCRLVPVSHPASLRRKLDKLAKELATV